MHTTIILHRHYRLRMRVLRRNWLLMWILSNSSFWNVQVHVECINCQYLIFGLELWFPVKMKEFFVVGNDCTAMLDSPSFAVSYIQNPLNWRRKSKNRTLRRARRILERSKALTGETMRPFRFETVSVDNSLRRSFLDYRLRLPFPHNIKLTS